MNQIIKTLKSKGFEAVFAGGWVRDKILKITSKDIDIATDATPDQVESFFPKTISIGKAFGVVVVVIDGIEFEVATFRSDGKYQDGRRPKTVKFSSMREDALRRDLTINGMFYDPTEDKIIDYVDGQEDLKNKIIRCIGNPYDRISEDKLRMLRVVRFASKLGFRIEERTFEAVKIFSSEITQISVERIADEIQKILRVKNIRHAIKILFSTQLINYILPEVKAMEGVEQPPQFHPEGDVLEHTILALELLPEDASDELRMATLLHDVGKPPTFRMTDRIRFNNHDVVGAEITKKILKRMKFSNDFSEHVISLVANHMKFRHVHKMKTSRLKRFIRMYKFEEHKILHNVDCMSSHGDLRNLSFLEKLSFPPENIIPPRIITGHDLIKMGFKQGPVFRKILTAVEDEQLEEKISTNEEAIEFVKNNNWE